jgi:hypothetical protein
MFDKKSITGLTPNLQASKERLLRRFNTYRQRAAINEYFNSIKVFQYKDFTLNNTTTKKVIKLLSKLFDQSEVVFIDHSCQSFNYWDPKLVGRYPQPAKFATLSRQFSEWADENEVAYGGTKKHPKKQKRITKKTKKQKRITKKHI